MSYNGAGMLAPLSSNEMRGFVTPPTTTACAYCGRLGSVGVNCDGCGAQVQMRPLPQYTVKG